MAKSSKKKAVTGKAKPAKGKAKSGRSVGQLLSLIIVLAILVGVSVTTTLMLTGTIAIYDKGIGTIPSINEAKMLCDDEIRETQKGVRSLHLDDRSSHHHDASQRYKLFYEIDLYKGKTKQEGVQKFYANCFVDEVKGRVTVFEMFEAQDYKPPPLRKSGGNAFGM